MGTFAGHQFHESRDETIVVGAENVPGKRDHLDTVAMNQAHTVMNVVEEKGAGARLGKRDVAGLWVSQGSSGYLNKLMHIDPDIGEYLRGNQDDVRRLMSGEMELRHHVLYAKAHGSVVIQRMKLNPSVLHLEDFLLDPVSPRP